ACECGFVHCPFGHGNKNYRRISLVRLCFPPVDFEEYKRTNQRNSLVSIHEGMISGNAIRIGSSKVKDGSRGVRIAVASTVYRRRQQSLVTNSGGSAKFDDLLSMECDDISQSQPAPLHFASSLRAFR